MKTLSYLVTAGMLVSNLALATSPVMPAPEQTIMHGTLRPTGDTAVSPEPKAITLTMKRRIGSEAATRFTVYENTGIVCVTAPCPTTRYTDYVVTGVHASFHHGDSVRYEATEVIRHIRPNVRIAPRKLIVTESTIELVIPGGFQRRTVWEVEVERFSRTTQTYVAYPQRIWGTR